MLVDVEGVLAWIRRGAELIGQNRDHLTDLDAAIGDGDHGVNMERGFRAVLDRLASDVGGDIGSVLSAVGMTLLSTVGGAGGPLYGTFFLQFGAATAGRQQLCAQDWAAGVQAGVRGVQRRGRADLGDKTMVDALAPASQSLVDGAACGAPLEELLSRAAEAAREGMAATIPLVARKGRASYLGERSAGHQDPGATSSYLLMRAAADALSGGGLALPEPSQNPAVTDRR
ncbi:MAG: dihydroxyacetone kinase subunit DhaL [Actinomycetota bacterium]